MAEKSYDLSQLKELAGGSEKFVLSMVDTFLEHTPRQLGNLKQAYATGNLETTGELAHKIKPNIDLFGISELTTPIRIIESKGKAGEGEELSKNVEQVDEVLQTVFNQLKAYKDGKT